jgi:hypothetical protein
MRLRPRRPARAARRTSHAHGPSCPRLCVAAFHLMQYLRAGPLVLPGVALHPVIMRGQILVAGPVQQLGRQDDRYVGREDPACSGSRRAGTSPPARHHPSRVTGILSTPRLCTRQERITVPVRGNTPSTWRPSTSCYSFEPATVDGGLVGLVAVDGGRTSTLASRYPGKQASN